MINTSRRDFLAMLGITGGIIAAPVGFCAAVAPERRLRFGVLSDIHLQFEHSFGEYWKLERALAWFKDQDVDAVVIAGDIAENGLITEFETFAKMWYGFFPEDGRHGRKKVERVFIFGNHDSGIVWRIPKMFPNDEEGKKKAILKYNQPAVWKRCFGEEFTPWYVKDVKGYKFLCSHWRTEGADADGFPELPEYLKTHAEEIGKTKPFFVVKHSHPLGTCHCEERQHGNDSGKDTTSVLKAFPNAVCFSGHSHNSLTDERACWQREFTSIGTASLCYSTSSCGHRITHHAMAPKNHPYAISGGDIHHGMIVDVHDGFLTVRRREFRYGLPLGEDWIVPCPVTPDSAMIIDKRRGAKRPPAYKTQPKVEVKDGVVTFAAVPQGDKAFTRVYGYEVTATNKDSAVKPVVMSVRTAAADMPLETEPDIIMFCVKANTFKNPADWTFKVVPFDSFGTPAA